MDRFLAPDGKTSNKGTEDSPWPLAEVLGDGTRQFAQPGDTCYLLSGRYVWPERNTFNYGFRWKTQGAEGAPITFRPHERRGRVTIDGGIHSHESQMPRFSIIDGLEILVGENEGGVPTVDDDGSGSYESLKRPYGGVNLPVGYAVHVRRCVIRDGAQGVGLWGTVSGGSELYGNIIFDNGWRANDRLHGHGIYAQNNSPDWKFISQNILTRSRGFSVQIYGSSAADCSRFSYNGNVSYDSGTVYIQPTKKSRNLIARDNLHYAGKVAGAIAISNYTNVTATGNVGIGGFAVARCDGELDVRNNLNWQAGWAKPRVDDVEIPIPDAAAWLFIDGYDPDRLHLAIHDYKSQRALDVDFRPWAKAGEAIALYDPTNLFGDPVKVIEVGSGPSTIEVVDGHACYVGFRVAADPCAAVRRELDIAQQEVNSLRNERDRLTRLLTDSQRQTTAAEEKNASLLADVDEVRKILNRWGA